MSIIIEILFLVLIIFSFDFGVDSCQISYNFPNVGAYIFLQNANYPYPYGDNINCQYNFTSPVNTVMYLQCYDFKVQSSPNCGLDVFYYSLTGDSNFADKYLACGQGNFSQYSQVNSLTIGFISDSSNPASSYPYRFSCMISAIRVTPPPIATTSSPINSPTTCNCGIRNEEPSTKIVGGLNALPNEFPWRCGLTQGQNPFCDCTIISANYVLTAGHCVQVIDSTRPLYVDVGDYDLSNIEPTSSRIKVTKIITNLLYNSTTHDNDVTLLKLETKLSFSEKYIQPACLPWTFISYNFQGQNVTASGWGTLTEGGSQPTILQKVDLPVLTTEECQQYYGSMITKNMICTYKPGKDTCQGDSGGSIDWRNPQNGLYYAIGVTSWGVGCAELNNPGVYIKVTNYLQWIKQNTPGETFCNP